MPFLEYYCEVALLIGGLPLEEVGEKGVHLVIQVPFCCLLLHRLVYAW
jgi:hypothetical protein